MLGRLLEAVQRKASRNEHSWRLASGMRIYAVGDIHGRDDLLDILLSKICDDLHAGPAPERAFLVFVGDYIDRGMQSRQVIERLSRLAIDRLETIFLRGNHEQVMCDFLADARLGPQWCSFGGDTTLASYGIAAPRMRCRDEGWEETRAALANALPVSHRMFLDGLRLYTCIDPYLFVHAGVDPALPLAQQSASECLWIRAPFLTGTRLFSHCVVHGHTPSDAPYRDHRRIGIDTGAYVSGVLSAVRLEEESVFFIQT